jgi:hypothetical protein
MSLKLHSVVNGKTPNAEYVWAQSSGVTNLGGYAIIDRTFSQTAQLSNEFRHVFVFPTLQIADGDWVRLYTGKGTYLKQTIDNSTAFIHNFYWGSGTCVWNDAGGDIASLLEIKLVNSVTVPAVI